MRLYYLCRVVPRALVRNAVSTRNVRRSEVKKISSSSWSSSMTAHPRLWRIVAGLLYLQDALSGALLLPVLPALVEQLLGTDSGFLLAWVVAALLASYYLGRSLTLGAATRLCSGSSRAPETSPPSLLGIGALLILSAATYVGCGIVVVVDHEQPQQRARVFVAYFCLFRALSGCLAAGHQLLAGCCLVHAGLLEREAATITKPVVGKSLHESVGVMGGLVAGFLAGGLFDYYPSRPTLLLGLAAAAAHTPALLSVVLVAWRNRHCSRRSSGGTIRGDYSTVQGTPGGSETEVELMGRPPWSGRGDSFDEGRGAAAALTPPVGDASEGITVPGRYLRGCAGDVVEAERRWRLTLDWRAKELIDQVLREPQPHFEVIKQHYPHFIHRRARNGCPVWIELPGRIDLSAIRSAGVSPEALQRHYIFVTEYMWGVLEPDFENGQAVTVLDVQGLGMRDLAGEALGFVKQAAAIVQDHYVERSNRMFIVNAPSYFSLIWRVIRPMLNERTQSKIGIINADTKKIAAALLECIASENLPRRYGGTCPLDLGESEEEADLRAFVASIAGSPPHAKASPGLETPSLAEDEDEVKVDLGTGSYSATRAVAGPRSKGSPAGGPAAKAGSEARRRTLDERGSNGRGETGGGDLGRVDPPSGVARRVFGSVRGALGWAGGKLARRRPPVAHLGEDNGFQYDRELRRWVLRDETGGDNGRKTRGGGDAGHAGGIDASAGEGGDGSERWGERGGQSTSIQRERGRSVSSEEMTVLAIQAAHHSLSALGTKFSPTPSGKPAVPGARHGVSPCGLARDGHHHHPVTVTNLEVRCPCLRPFGRRASQPDVATVLYASSTAIREAFPVWLLAGANAGGIGVSPLRVGVLFAAAVLIAEAGRGAVTSGCCGASRIEGGAGGTWRAGRRLLHVVWARLASVVFLGVVFLLPTLLPTRSAAVIPPEVFWLAVTAVVATNHASLELCSSAAAAAAAIAAAATSTAGSWEQPPTFISRSSSSSSHNGDYGRARTTSTTSGGGLGGGGRRRQEPGARSAISHSSLFVGDVIGSIAGPLVVGFAMWTGQRSPLEPSLWLVLGLCGDSWLAACAREAEPRHTVLLDGEEEEEEDEEGRRWPQLSSQFV